MEKYDQRYWLNKLRKAKEVREQFYKNAKESISVFTGNLEGLNSTNGAIRDVQRRINSWSFICNTLIPAYYSKPPEIIGKLRYEREEPTKLLSALIAEKSANYQLDEENDINKIMYHFVSQFLLAGFGCLWVRYDPSFDESEIVSERVVLESLCYDDYLCSDARKPDEITWKARRAFLSREEAEARFGSDKLKEINFNLIEELDKNETGATEIKDLESGFGDKASFWEIWCYETKKVYWLNYESDVKGTILEESDPPVSLVGFYPCSELSANLAPNSVIPTSLYSLVRDSILEVERLTERIHSCIQAIRANFLYDSALGSDLASLFTSDYKGYPVTNRMVSGVTRIADGIEFLPVAQYIQSLEVLTAARQEELNRLFEETGASDLMRGVSNPAETATAQALKNSYTSLRFQVPQRHIAESLEKALNIIGEVVSENFSDETILSTSNAFMLIPQALEQAQQANPQQAAPMPQDPNIPPQQQPMAPQMPMQPIEDPKIMMLNEALQILRDDFARRITLEIKSDSMIALDERENRAERLEFLDASSRALTQLMPLTKEFPGLIDAIKEQYRFVLRSFKGHKDLEPQLMSVFDAVKMQIEQQQPTPDPEAIRMQMEQQKLDANMQLEYAKMQLKRDELMFQANKLMTEQQMEMAKNANDQQLATIKQANDNRMLELKAMMEDQKIEIEKYKVVMMEREKLIEERRLSEQSILEKINAIETLSKSQAQPSQPPVILNIGGSDKQINIVRDPLTGELTGVSKSIPSQG